MRLDIHVDLTKEVLQRPIKYYRSPIIDTAFHINTSIEELLTKLRSKKIAQDIYYFYAVDENNVLYGVLSTREILFNQPHTRLIDIVNEEIVTLHENVSVEHALKVLSEHQFLSVPMVDDEYRLIGLFEINPFEKEFSSRFKKRPTKEVQDIFQIIGFTIEKSKLDSKWIEYRYRMPWLIGNLFAGLVCAAIAAFFYETLAQVIVLSFFIPLVLTLAEAISMQSMTLSLQFLHYRELPWQKIFKRMLHEWFVALLLGVTSAILLVIYYLFSLDSDWLPDLPAFAIAISILIAMAVAASFGTLFPLLLHKFKLDPKVAAGPVVLMLTDIMTTAVYLGFATWLLL